MRRALLPRWRDRDRPLVRWPLTRPAGEPLTWYVQERDQLAVVVVDGELDVGTAPGLAADLTPLAEAGRDLILDLAGVRFCDCAGLSLFLRAQKQATAAGGSLHLAAATRARPQRTRPQRQAKGPMSRPLTEIDPPSPTARPSVCGSGGRFWPGTPTLLAWSSGLASVWSRATVSRSPLGWLRAASPLGWLRAASAPGYCRRLEPAPG